VVCPPQPNLTPAIEDLEALQELAQSVIDYLKEPV
jgi:hypothetical protein